MEMVWTVEIQINMKIWLSQWYLKFKQLKLTQKYFRTSMAFQLVWVFIAQFVEYCSTNQEAMGSNPIKVRKFYLC